MIARRCAVRRKFLLSRKPMNFFRAAVFPMDGTGKLYCHALAVQGPKFGPPARAGLHQAPRFLPLLHRMEERAGEEARFYWFRLSSVLPPRSSRGEDGELDAALPPAAAEPRRRSAHRPQFQL